MPTQTLAPGTYVQLNPSVESTRAGKPSAEEKTIGKVAQAFTAQGKQYYQVIWNPGDMRPKTGTYHEDELTALSQQQAQQTIQQMSSGNLPNLPEQGSNYQAPGLETSALPPDQQPIGQYSL